jgi:RNA polymerase sigma-70 factor (ECF subfamily)
MVRRGADDLVAAARSGDEQAWRELYLLHGRRLIVWLRSLPMADVASSADDIASEAWLTAAEKVGQFRGSDDDFAGWLFTIARNHASNRHRTALRRRTEPVAVESSPEVLSRSFEDPNSHVDSQDATRALLAHLTPREAQVVACIDVVGLDVASTATALGMKPTAVRVARHRALGRLRKILTEQEGSPETSLAFPRPPRSASSDS